MPPWFRTRCCSRYRAACRYLDCSPAPWDWHRGDFFSRRWNFVRFDVVHLAALFSPPFCGPDGRLLVKYGAIRRGSMILRIKPGRRRAVPSRLAVPSVPSSFLMSLPLILVTVTGSFAADATFAKWLASLLPEAQQMGVSRTTFETATRGIEPDFSLPDLAIPGRPEAPQPSQPEFVRTPADYLRESTIARLAANGAKLREQYRAALDRIEQRFGVPGAVVLAIWGRESDFSTHSSGQNAIQVLATQAYVGKRKDMFRQEFLLALKMMEDGVRPTDLRSSWGGAMGLTQFLPSEFYKY